jgi:hypothetical protein
LQGRLQEAHREMRQALDGAERSDGAAHPWTQQIRIRLAGILREEKLLSDAQAELARVDREALKQLPAGHPLLGQLRREEGLLLRAQGDAGGARRALAEALEICEHRYGSTHWRTQRAREELADAAPPGRQRS